jgi:hypothetical protein
VLPTTEIVAAIEALAEARSDRFALLQCSRTKVGRVWRSVYESKPVQELSPVGPWQYFLQSRLLTPAIPAPEPLAGTGWPGAFAANGLISLQHPAPGADTSGPPPSRIGIVHRLVGWNDDRTVEHSDYDEIFRALKAKLQRTNRATGAAS